MMQTTGKLIGATVYALNLTHGLAPSRPRGDFETVVQADDYNGAVMTAEGNYYSLTNYGIQRYAK